MKFLVNDKTYLHEVRRVEGSRELGFQRWKPKRLYKICVVHFITKNSKNNSDYKNLT